MKNYYFSNKAIDDLSKNYEYLFKFLSENHADRYYEEVIKFCYMLAQNPKRGILYDEIAPNLYGFILSKSIIYYKTIDTHAIVIYRILDLNMEICKIPREKLRQARMAR